MADSHCAGHPGRVEGRWNKRSFCVFKTTAPNQYNVNWISIGKQQSTGASQRAWKTVKTSFELVRSDIGGALQVRIPGTSEPYRLAVFNMNGQRVINPVSVAGGMFYIIIGERKHFLR